MPEKKSGFMFRMNMIIVMYVYWFITRLALILIDGAQYILDVIYHNGPAQAYLARAPNDDLANFNGTDGQWFKIASITAAHDTKPNPDYWISYMKSSVYTPFPTTSFSFT